MNSEQIIILFLQVTDGSEQDAQASQTPPVNRRFLPLYRNPHFYSIPVNTNHSAVHVPSNVYERCKFITSKFNARD